MANLNRVLMIGRLTRDPEIRQTPGGASVCDFGMATNRNYTVNGEKREETCYVDMNAWGKQAELIKQYTSKGSQLFVEGRLQFDQWEAQDGGKRSKLRVVVENFQFLSSGRREDRGGSGEQDLDPADFGFGAESRPSSGGGGGGGSEAAAEDDLPF